MVGKKKPSLKKKSAPEKNQDLTQIFNTLKKSIKKYEKYFTPRMNFDSKYDLWSEKEVEILGKKRKEVYFLGLIIQSSYVGFYYMPVYANDDIKNFFSPELLKLLKGKSCFHIKSLDKPLLKDIEFALSKGLELYKQKGWV